MDVLRHCEREIVRALKATGSTQSQVTHADRFEIATDDVVVKVWTVDAYERERGAVERVAELEADLKRERAARRIVDEALRDALASQPEAARLVELYREYGSPDLTALVEAEAKRTGGR